MFADFFKLIPYFLSTELTTAVSLKVCEQCCLILFQSRGSELRNDSPQQQQQKHTKINPTSEHPAPPTDLQDGILPLELPDDRNYAELRLGFPHIPALALLIRVWVGRLEEAPLTAFRAVEYGQGGGEEPLGFADFLGALTDLHLLAKDL